MQRAVVLFALYVSACLGGFLGIPMIPTRILSIIAVCSVNATVYTVSCPAVASNSIYSNSNNTNGAGQYLYVGEPSGTYEIRSMLRFDVAGCVGTGATITAANLNLFLIVPGTGLPTISLYAMAESWNESIAGQGIVELNGAVPLTGNPTWTFESYPTIDWTTEGAISGSVVQEAAITDNTGGTDTSTLNWSSANFLALIQTWYTTPAGNFGFLVTGTSGLANFGSRHNTKSAVQPFLSVTFNSATPPPSPITPVNYAPPPVYGAGYGTGPNVKSLSSGNTGAIIGGIVGGCVVLALIVSVATILLRR